MLLTSRRVDVWVAGLAAVAGGLVWYRIEHQRSNVATALVFFVAAGMGLAVALRLLVRVLGRPALVSRVTVLAVAVALSVIGVEAALRYGVRTRLTYSESNGSPLYRSIYRYENPAWYHLYGRNQTIREVKTEFTHVRRTNALGLPERDVVRANPADEYRVLALGDSFAEGVDATYEESWVRVFERALSPLPDGRVVRAINAGVSASDLLLEYVVFRDRLATYRPDLVIAALNNRDITDVLTRGGMERFREDGRIHGDRGPWWDWLNGLSYITRHIVHDVLGRSWLLLAPADHAAAHAAARPVLRAAIDDIAALSRDLGAAFVLVFYPHQYGVQARSYYPGFEPLVDELAASGPPHVIDLLARYQETGALTASNSGDYYWTLDFYHNARGYALMGETIAAEVRARRLSPGGP